MHTIVSLFFISDEEDRSEETYIIHVIKYYYFAKIERKSWMKNDGAEKMMCQTTAFGRWCFICACVYLSEYT